MAKPAMLFSKLTGSQRDTLDQLRKLGDYELKWFRTLMRTILKARKQNIPWRVIGDATGVPEATLRTWVSNQTYPKRIQERMDRERMKEE